MSNGHPWTKDEDEILRRFLPSHGPGWEGWKELLPDRSRYAISARKVSLGIAGPRSRPKSREAWTEVQKRTLARKALEMIREVHHPIDECIAMLDKMMREQRSGLR
jgi:hypothetical protein